MRNFDRKWIFVGLFGFLFIFFSFGLFLNPVPIFDKPLSDLNGSFLDLNDTPVSYSGSGGDFVQVNVEEEGLVFTTASISGDTNQVKVSSNDSDPGFLEEKLSAGSNITLAVLNEGGDESIEISSTASGSGGSDGICDNNSDCTITGTIDTNLPAIIHNVLSVDDLNASIGDLNDSQSCPNGQALQSVGNSTACVSVGDSNGITWSELDNVIPWQDENVSNDLNLSNIQAPDTNIIFYSTGGTERILWNLTSNKYGFGTVEPRGRIDTGTNGTIYSDTDQEQENGELIRLVFNNIDNPNAKASIAFQDQELKTKAWLAAHQGSSGGDHNHFSIEITDDFGVLNSILEFPYDENTTDVTVNNGNLFIRRNTGKTNGNLTLGGLIRHDGNFSFLPHYASNLNALSIRVNGDGNISQSVNGGDYISFGDNVIPLFDSTFDLGSLDKRWENFYTNNLNASDIHSDGNVTVDGNYLCDENDCYFIPDLNLNTGGMDTNCSLNEECVLTGTINTGFDSNFNGDVNITGPVTVTESDAFALLVENSIGSDKFRVDTDSSTVYSVLLRPTSDNAHDLGQAGARWRDLLLSRNALIDGNLFVDGNTLHDGNTITQGITFVRNTIDSRQNGSNPYVLTVSGGTCPFGVGAFQGLETGQCFNRQGANDVVFYFQGEPVFTWFVEGFQENSFHIKPDDSFVPFNFPARYNGSVLYVHESTDYNVLMMQKGLINPGDPAGFSGYRPVGSYIPSDFNADFEGSLKVDEDSEFFGDLKVGVDLNVLDDVFVPNQDGTGAIVTDVVYNSVNGKYLTETSSESVKEDIKVFDSNSWKFVEDVNIVSYVDIETKQEVPIGVVAEQTAKNKDSILSGLTTYSDLNQHSGVPTGFSYDRVGLVLVDPIRDLRNWVDELFVSLGLLDARVLELENRVGVLETELEDVRKDYDSLLVAFCKTSFDPICD